MILNKRIITGLLGIFYISIAGPQWIGARVKEQPHDAAVVGEDRVVQRGAAAKVGAQVQIVAELLLAGHHHILNKGNYLKFTNLTIITLLRRGRYVVGSEVQTFIQRFLLGIFSK